MTSLEQLINDFKEAYNGSPWFGDSFVDIVTDINPAEAIAIPPNGHSIAVLVWHLVKWRKALTERLLGNMDFRADESDADNWPDAQSQTAATWEASKLEMEAQQKLLIDELAKREEIFLETEFMPNKTFRSLAHGVLQHDLYHLGQIAFVKSLIRNHHIW